MSIFAMNPIKKYSSESTAYLQPQSPITFLADELAIMVGSFLSGADLGSLKKTCRRFNHLYKDERLWKIFCERDFPQRRLQDGLLHSLQYQWHYQTQMNWKKGGFRYQELDTSQQIDLSPPFNFIRGENTSYTPDLPSVDNRMTKRGPCDTIEIWDRRNGKLYHTFSAFLGLDIACIISEEELLYVYATSELSGALLGWNLKTKERFFCQDPCMSPIIDKDHLIAATPVELEGRSSSDVIVVWNKYDGSILHQLSPVGWAEHLQAEDDLLFFVSNHDKLIKVFHRTTSQLREFPILEKVNGLKKFAGNYLGAICEKGTILIWNLNEDLPVPCRILCPPADRVRGNDFVIDGCLLLINYGYHFMDVWNWESGSLLYSLSEIRFFDVVGLKIILRKEGGQFQIIDKKTGALLQSGQTPSLDYRSILVDDNWMIFHSQSMNALYFWNQSKMCFQRQIDCVANCDLKGDQLTIKFLDGKIIIWDFSSTSVFTSEGCISIGVNNEISLGSNTVVKTILVHQEPVLKIFQLKEGTIVSRTAECTKFWNSNFQCVQTYKNSRGNAIDSFFERSDGSIIVKEVLSDNSSGITVLNPGRWMSSMCSMAQTKKINVVHEFNDGVFATGSEDATIQLWGPGEHPRRLAFLQGHAGSVTSIIEVEDNAFISASSDGAIKKWNREGECLGTFLGHGSEVNQLYNLADGTFLSSSLDGLIKRWNKSGECLCTYIGHKCEVTLLRQFNDRSFVSCSCDGLINRWDIENGRAQTLHEHTGEIIDLVGLENGSFFTSSSDSTIKGWDLNEKSILTLDDFGGHSTLIKLQNNTLVYAAKDNKVKVFALDGTILHTLQTHEDTITSLIQLADGTIVTGSRDKTIKLCHFL